VFDGAAGAPPLDVHGTRRGLFDDVGDGLVVFPARRRPATRAQAAGVELAVDLGAHAAQAEDRAFPEAADRDEPRGALGVVVGDRRADLADLTQQAEADPVVRVLEHRDRYRQRRERRHRQDDDRRRWRGRRWRCRRRLFDPRAHLAELDGETGQARGHQQ